MRGLGLGLGAGLAVGQNLRLVENFIGREGIEQALENVKAEYKPEKDDDVLSGRDQRADAGQGYQADRALDNRQFLEFLGGGNGACQQRVQAYRQNAEN